MNDPGGPDERTWASDDGRLLTMLKEMLHDADPPPPQAVELARQSFGLRALDAELAMLVEDSEDAAGAAPALAVRAAGAAAEPRQLTFHVTAHGQDLVIAVQVESLGERRRLSGHLTPAGPTQVELRQPAGPRVRAVDVDRLGRFVIDDVRAGPTSLTCRRAGSADVVTQWTVL